MKAFMYKDHIEESVTNIEYSIMDALKDGFKTNVKKKATIYK